MGDATASARPAPSRADRVLMASAALAFGVAGVTVLWYTVLWSAYCLDNAGDTSPYCESRWSVPVSAVVVVPLVALCAVSAVATARGARHGRRLTRRERRRVIALLVVLTLVGLVQPLGYLLVAFTWFVIVSFVLLVRGVAAVTRSASRSGADPPGADPPGAGAPSG